MSAHYLQCARKTTEYLLSFHIVHPVVDSSAFNSNRPRFSVIWIKSRKAMAIFIGAFWIRNTRLA
jgi:hypothetical protein